MMISKFWWYDDDVASGDDDNDDNGDVIADYDDDIYFEQVLKTGQEIMELDHSGFSTQGSTVYSGNIGNNSYIVQVSAMGVRLLQGGQPPFIPTSVLCSVC